ncbi:MAG: putative O-glycosylation ligase, exosortase A system-associated [Rhodospirillaceae bacterium]|nr:putative O-glycosylation ligase, exosortase A system-associated [Rhodospirillales bacterium]
MRDIILVLGLLSLVPLVLRFPFAGVLAWEWLSLMNPHREVYGFALGQPFNSAIAVLTLAAWVFSKERKAWPDDRLSWVLVALGVWMSFNSLFAVEPDWSWPLWERTIKILVFVMLLAAMAVTKARLHATIWVMVISLGYFGVKGGVFTILTAGNNKVLGPENTIIADNNHLALAIVMLLPLVNYLRLHTANRLIRLGLGAAMALQVLTVLGSYSRGGMVALAVTAGYFWLRSKRKVSLALAGAVVFAISLSIMPPAFFERMDTIQDAAQDESFRGRLVSWQVCVLYARDHFPFGAGFSGTERTAVYNSYFPDEFTHAAHSIYFQVLGEHGVPGLLLYMAAIGLGFLNCRAVMRQTRDRPGYSWAYDLANMSGVSLLAFCTGGAALSMAYYDGFLMLLVLMAVLRKLTHVGARTAPALPRGHRAGQSVPISPIAAR